VAVTAAAVDTEVAPPVDTEVAWAAVVASMAVDLVVGGFHGGGGGFHSSAGFHGAGLGGGGFRGGGFHGGLASRGFHGGGFHRGGFHRRAFVGFGLGSYGYYDGYYPYAYNDDYYDDGGCYVVRRRVQTRYGWRVRRVEVCG
jgi:hypothetical protein